VEGQEGVTVWLRSPFQSFFALFGFLGFLAREERGRPSEIVAIFEIRSSCSTIIPVTND
jgi:hypothetical protein